MVAKGLRSVPCNTAHTTAVVGCATTTTATASHPSVHNDANTSVVSHHYNDPTMTFAHEDSHVIDTGCSFIVVDATTPPPPQPVSYRQLLPHASVVAPMLDAEEGGGSPMFDVNMDAHLQPTTTTCGYSHHQQPLHESPSCNFSTSVVSHRAVEGDLHGGDGGGSPLLLDEWCSPVPVIVVPHLTNTTRASATPQRRRLSQEFFHDGQHTTPLHHSSNNGPPNEVPKVALPALQRSASPQANPPHVTITPSATPMRPHLQMNSVPATTSAVPSPIRQLPPLHPTVVAIVSSPAVTTSPSCVEDGSSPDIVMDAATTMIGAVGESPQAPLWSRSVSVSLGGASPNQQLEATTHGATTTAADHHVMLPSMSATIAAASQPNEANRPNTTMQRRMIDYDIDDHVVDAISRGLGEATQSDAKYNNTSLRTAVEVVKSNFEMTSQKSELVAMPAGKNNPQPQLPAAVGVDDQLSIIMVSPEKAEDHHVAPTIAPAVIPVTHTATPTKAPATTATIMMREELDVSVGALSPLSFPSRREAASAYSPSTSAMSFIHSFREGVEKTRASILNRLSEVSRLSDASNESNTVNSADVSFGRFERHGTERHEDATVVETPYTRKRAREEDVQDHHGDWEASQGDNNDAHQHLPHQRLPSNAAALPPTPVRKSAVASLLNTSKHRLAKEAVSKFLTTFAQDGEAGRLHQRLRAAVQQHATAAPNTTTSSSSGGADHQAIELRALVQVLLRFVRVGGGTSSHTHALDRMSGGDVFRALVALYQERIPTLSTSAASSRASSVSRPMGALGGKRSRSQSEQPQSDNEEHGSDSAVQAVLRMNHPASTPSPFQVYVARREAQQHHQAMTAASSIDDDTNSTAARMRQLRRRVSVSAHGRHPSIVPARLSHMLVPVRLTEYDIHSTSPCDVTAFWAALRKLRRTELISASQAAATTTMSGRNHH